MVVLTGKNLGERQRDLNNKVAEVVAKNADFNNIKDEEEVSDVDKLFKIDIASKYKDVDYIVEVLKSGDSLYISRALKCVWLYQENYINIVNTTNLHVDIFPFMSIKMKKKMLTTISMHVRDPERASSFYIYCKKHQMPNKALKFLNFTSDEFKYNVLKNDKWFESYPHSDKLANLQNFVGNSFSLAEAWVEIYDSWNRTHVHKLRYLYAVDSTKYLDFLEKYENVNLKKPNDLKRLGIRTSRDIMLKHKNRVLKNPLLYVNKLNKSMLIKYSSKSDAQNYISCLIPQCVEVFWEINFCTVYDYIFNIIPKDEKFEYIKQLYTTKYPEEAFEMSIRFYKLHYYNMLTIEQRELWALRHIQEQKEILGIGNDYMWYKFVNIDKTLEEIKKYVMVTPDSNKRGEIVNILIEAARDQKDLKKVLDYYYDRHVNEDESNKNNFIYKVLSAHNAFEFNLECWEALNKLFYSLDVYTVGTFPDKVYLAVAVICHILHNIDMPKALMEFIELDVNYTYFSLLMNKLSKEKAEIVLQHLVKLFVEKLKPFEQDPHNKKLRDKLRKYVNNIFNLLTRFEKRDEECPEIVKKFMEIHSPKPETAKTVTAKDIFYFIKTDAILAINVLGDQNLNIYDCPRLIVNKTLRKVKVYFHNDVVPEYINFLDRTINESSGDYDGHKRINAAIFGLFFIGGEDFIVNLMEKYHPSESKIDHSVIDRKLLYIQEAICRFVAYSRPPVPLETVLRYIKGDYVHYCLPMFNIYLVNLSPPLVMKFTESILNAPLSVQKHGLRLAFECYMIENLKTLVLDTWKKSKNVSLRKILFKSLYNKLSEQVNVGDEEHAKILYEAFKFFTSDLNQDDDEDLFDLISSYRCGHHLSNTFMNDHLQTAWRMVVKLPKKSVNIDRQIKVVNSIVQNMNVVQRDFVRKDIIDGHVYEVLEQRRLRPDELQKVQNLWNAKWYLTGNYIVRFGDNEELKEILALVSHIFKKCLEMWYDRYKDTFIFQKFYFDFITCIENNSHVRCCENSQGSRVVAIFEHILEMLQKALPLKEIYLLVWSLKLTIYLGISLIATNTAMCEGDRNLKPLSREEILSENYAYHIKIFVQELLSKHKFYPVYLSGIVGLLKSKLRSLHNMKNLDIVFSESLANAGLKETHLLALMILPADVQEEEIKEIHTRTLKKIQGFENDEIQSYLHFKFLSTFKHMFSRTLSQG